MSLRPQLIAVPAISTGGAIEYTQAVAAGCDTLGQEETAHHHKWSLVKLRSSQREQHKGPDNSWPALDSRALALGPSKVGFPVQRREKSDNGGCCSRDFRALSCDARDVQNALSMSDETSAMNVVVSGALRPDVVEVVRQRALRNVPSSLVDVVQDRVLRLARAKCHLRHVSLGDLA